MELVGLRHDIEDINQRLDEATRMYAHDPSREDLSFLIYSLTTQRDDLEMKWVDLAQSFGKHVCVYRIRADEEHRPSVAALSDMLGAFQRSVSVVYDGVINGPKRRARLSREVRDDTRLEFGFTSSGSLMVTMTVQKSQLSFFDDEDATTAIDAVLGISQATESKDLLKYAENYGRPAIRSVYEWVCVHAQHGFDIDVSWFPEDDVNERHLVAYNEHLVELQDLIESTNDETVYVEEHLGSLQDWNRKRRKFIFSVDEETPYEVAGVISTKIDIDRDFAVPGYYHARISRVVREEMATKKRHEEVVLEELHPMGAALNAV